MFRPNKSFVGVIDMTYSWIEHFREDGLAMTVTFSPDTDVKTH